MAAVLMLGGSASAEEADRGSIRIMLSDGAEGTSKEGVVFGYARVAALVDGQYRDTGNYAGAADWENIRTAREMEAAAAKLREMTKEPDGTMVTDRNGMAEITDLEEGVYVVYTEEQADYETVTPLLVSIPAWDESVKGMNYQVRVIPKHEPVKNRKPEAPQTGLDSRYGELAAGAAVLLALSGAVFRLNNRKRRTGR